MRRIKLSLRIVGMAMAAILSNCGNPQANPERYVITDVDPFYKTEVPYRPNGEREIVKATQAFAHDHGMDYLGGPGHPTLEKDEFLVSANSRMLNLKAARNIPISPNVQIFAIARGVPTPQDRELLMEFVCRVSGDCASAGSRSKEPTAR